MPIPYEKLTYNDILHHKAAYDRFDMVGKALFADWDIIGFEKAVLGFGDEHYLYMADKIKETPNLYGDLDTKMPILRFLEEGQHYAYELFITPPTCWGSEGTPLWWAYASRKLSAYTLPVDEETLFEAYNSVAKEFGIKINSGKPYYIERFDAGGLNAGIVSGDFVRSGWYTIRDRNQLYQNGINKNVDLYLDKAKERISWYCNRFRADEFELVPDMSKHDFIFAMNDSKINEHQMEIAFLLWGVFTGTPLTITEVANIKGVSYEAIRSIESRVLQKLLSNKNRGTIIRPKE